MALCSSTSLELKNPFIEGTKGKIATSKSFLRVGYVAKNEKSCCCNGRKVAVSSHLMPGHLEGSFMGKKRLEEPSQKMDFVRTLLIDNYDSYTYNIYQELSVVNGGMYFLFWFSLYFRLLFLSLSVCFFFFNFIWKSIQLYCDIYVERERERDCSLKLSHLVLLMPFQCLLWSSEMMSGHGRMRAITCMKRELLIILLSHLDLVLQHAQRI
jgi:hypothetical protein